MKRMLRASYCVLLVPHAHLERGSRIEWMNYLRHSLTTTTRETEVGGISVGNE